MAGLVFEKNKGRYNADATCTDTNGKVSRRDSTGAISPIGFGVCMLGLFLASMLPESLDWVIIVPGIGMIVFGIMTVVAILRPHFTALRSRIASSLTKTDQIPPKVPVWEIVLWVLALPISILGRIAVFKMASEAPTTNHTGRVFGPILTLFVIGFPKWTWSLFKRLFQRSGGTRRHQ